jgi:hypothetical protein
MRTTNELMKKVLKTFLGDNIGDPFAAVVYWSNAPRFPFRIRDGIDVSSYHRDDVCIFPILDGVLLSAKGVFKQYQESVCYLYAIFSVLKVPGLSDPHYYNI